MSSKDRGPNVSDESGGGSGGGMTNHIRGRVKLQYPGINIDLRLSFGASGVRMLGKCGDGERGSARGANDAGSVGGET